MKRAFDVLVSAGLLAFLLVPGLLVALLVRVILGRPVLFRQERVGRGGKLFRIVKFRTMRSGEGPDERRLGPLGRFLRAASIDELPGLWNVLKGDMSLVGPRPLLKDYLPLYTPEQARRHEVRPGVTGWAQVNGRNALTWEEKFELDVWYVDHPGFWLDLRILLLTAVKVFARQGISAAGEATMPPFRGTPGRS
jgi:lipopolysaccharide/colanic/teichoic acid biosynthesis glycosyltransferase